MSRNSYRHPHPERFVAGTVGVPGERTFFVQARSVALSTTLVLEKNQIETLALRLQEIIRDVRRNQLASLDELNVHLPRDNAPLEFPLDEEFRVGIIGIAWSQEFQRIIIEFQAIHDEEIDDLLSDEEALSMEAAPDLMSVHLRIAEARNFAERALALVASGRQPCMFCGLPIDPAGHLCPRANGYRR